MSLWPHFFGAPCGDKTAVTNDDSSISRAVYVHRCPCGEEKAEKLFEHRTEVSGRAHITASASASLPSRFHDFPAPCTCMVWYGTVNVDLYSAIITKVSNALNTLVSGEKPGFQALFKGLVVLLCAEVVRQGVPDHGAVHSECSASNSG